MDTAKRRKVLMFVLLAVINLIVISSFILFLRLYR